MCEPVSLTVRSSGSYTYCHRGLTSPFFPDTFFREQGGAAGWIPFSSGTLTDGRSDFVIWDMRSVAGSGVDLLVDLGADCRVDCVSLHQVLWSGYGCALGNLTLLARAEHESRFHLLRAAKPRNDGVPIPDPWPAFSDLHARCRFLRLRLEPAGRPTYDSSSIGLIGLEVLGRPVAEERSASDPPGLYPRPTRLRWLAGHLPITPHTAIPVLDGNRAAAEWLQERLQERLGQRLDSHPHGGPEIRLTHAEDGGRECYSLRVTPQGAEIRGDAAGLFYGAVSLLHLLQVRDGQTLVPAVSIEDGPRFSIRGVQLYMPARENIGFFKRLLDMMAGLKLNTVLLEVSGAMRYHSHPEINEAWVRFASEMEAYLERGLAPLAGDPLQLRRKHDGTHMNLAGGQVLEQEEVRDIVEYARARHITVVPEVQTLSHCYYITLAHPEFSERSDTPYPDTYCPSNPDVYPLVFDLLDEVLQVFQPPALCIGHDEAWAVGTCPRCREHSAAELIAHDVNQLARYLANHGVTPWMYADALDPDFSGWTWTNRELGIFSQPPDTRGLIDLMPRDLVALNWNWGHTWSHGEGPTVLERVIHQHGLRQLFANFEGAFFPDFAARSQACQAQGAILPSWVDSEHLALGTNGVIHNLIYSSNSLWSGGGETRAEDVDFQIGHVPQIRSQLGGLNTLAPNSECEMLPLSIADCANAPLADPLGSLGYYDLRSVPTGHVVLENTPFLIADPAANGGRAAIVVQSRAVHDPLYPQRIVDIPIGRCASGLYFLHVATDSADAVLDWARRDNPVLMGMPREARQLLGYYRIAFADGSIEQIDLRYDVHLSRWNTQYGARSVMPYLADPVWRGQTYRGEAVTLWRLGWRNPKPAQAIASLELVADEATDSAILLLAVTVLTRGMRAVKNVGE
jgi:hypothetical protein